MRQTIVIAVSALLVGTLWTPAAFAGGDWVFGAGFHIGRVSFQIGFHSDYRDRYYYRTRVDVGHYYRGHARCSRSCYHRGDYYYHSRSCPLVQAYFRDRGYYSDDVFARYAPGYDGYGYGYGYRDRPGYGYGYGYRDQYDDRSYGRRDYGHRGHRHHGHHRDYCPYH